MNIKKLTSCFFVALYGGVLVASGLDNTTSCATDDGKTKVFLKKSSPTDASRILWIERGGNKETIWQGKRQHKYSIATNRVSVEMRDVEPDPYENMELIKAAFNGEVLVVISKTKAVFERQKTTNPNYAGGFFNDQVFFTKRKSMMIVSALAPHSNYSWLNESFSKPNNYAECKAPWYDEHNGNEYFLRSFVKNKDGVWKVHVSAALSVLWADSMGLPISTLKIEGKNSYAVTFDGQYEYYTIKAKSDLDKLFESTLKNTKYRISFFDFYGAIETLIYKGDIKAGKTTERLRYVPSLKEGKIIDPFKTIQTTLHGGKSFYRVAYDKDYWRKINSWVAYDELSIDQVYRTDRPIIGGLDPLTMSDVKIGYGYLPRGYFSLSKGEVRQTYCLNIMQAKKDLEKRIVQYSKYAANDELFDFHLKRYELYLNLIERKLGESKEKLPEN